MIPQYVRNLGGVEDLVLSSNPTPVSQARGGVSVPITPIGAATIPATEKESILDLLYESKARELTALSHVQQPAGEKVIIYTSNGDGTFTETTTDRYSTLHTETFYSSHGMHLGGFDAEPITRRDGSALVEGDSYFNLTTEIEEFLQNGSWITNILGTGVGSGLADAISWEYEIGVTAGTTVGQTIFTGLNLTSGEVSVFFNGSHLFAGKDFTYDGISITLTLPTVANDIVQIYSYYISTATIIDCGTYDAAI